MLSIFGENEKKLKKILVQLKRSRNTDLQI